MKAGAAAAATAFALYRRRGRIRRCARRRIGPCAQGASRRRVDVQRGRRTRHGGRRHRTVRSPSTSFRSWACGDPAPAADDFSPDSRDRRRRGRRAPGRAGDHRQSGFHPPRRPPRAPACAQDPDPRLRFALGLGVAARARPRHARLCRSGAGHPAVRAGDVRQARRAAVSLCRPSADRAHCRIAAQCRGGAAPPRGSARRSGAAGKPDQRDPAPARHIRRRDRASCRALGPMELVLPTVPHLAAQVRAAVAGWARRAAVVVDPAEKWAAFRRARAALAASGTVTLELALAGIPTVAAYRMSPVEAIIAVGCCGCCSRLPSVILANLVLGENVIPELLQSVARRNASPRHSCRSSPTPRSGSARSRPSAGSMPSWPSAARRRAPRPRPSSSTWPNMAGAIRRRLARRHSRVNRRSDAALPLRRASC